MKGKVLEKRKIGNEFISYCSYSWWYEGRERRFNKQLANLCQNQFTKYIQNNGSV